MSLQNAIDFTVEVAKDPSLTAEVSKQLNGKSPDESARAFAALGESKGFDFTAAEASEARANAIQVSELSEEDLDKVAGGTGGNYNTANMSPAAQMTALGIREAASALSPVPIVGGIIGAGAGAAAGTAIDGGSSQDAGMAFVSGVNSALAPVKSVMQTIFSGW